MRTNDWQINHISDHRLSARWEFEGFPKINEIFKSPYALAHEMGFVFFSLDFHFAPATKVALIASHAGRAIIKLSVESSGSKETVMTVVNIQNNVINLKNLEVGNSVDSMIRKRFNVKINFDITWLGCIIKPNLIAQLRMRFVSPINHGVDPDIHIIIGDKKLGAHRQMLHYHSEILAYMAEYGGSRNEITLEHVDYSTMKVIIQMIYSRVIENMGDVDSVLKVLRATEKYKISVVKVVSECQLITSIQHDNVLMLLAEGIHNNARELCDACVKYIVAANGDILSWGVLEKLADQERIIKAVVERVDLNSAKYWTFQKIYQ